MIRVYFMGDIPAEMTDFLLLREGILRPHHFSKNTSDVINLVLFNTHSADMQAAQIKTLRRLMKDYEVIFTININ